jgi:hypothetical protein
MIMTTDKEYLTLAEASAEVNCKRGTLYAMMNKLGIKPHQFEMDRKSYLTREEVARIKAAREHPWKALKEKKK